MLFDFKNIQPYKQRHLDWSARFFPSCPSWLNEGIISFRILKAGGLETHSVRESDVRQSRFFLTWLKSMCLTSIPASPFSKKVAQINYNFKCLSEQREVNDRWRLMCILFNCKKNSMSLIIFNASNSIRNIPKIKIKHSTNKCILWTISWQNTETQFVVWPKDLLRLFFTDPPGGDRWFMRFFIHQQAKGLMQKPRFGLWLWKETSRIHSNQIRWFCVASQLTHCWHEEQTGAHRFLPAAVHH